MPTWLDEAYSEGNLSINDTGAAQRALLNFTATFFACRVLGIETVSDVGGGDGFLARLLRDKGIAAYADDPFSALPYMSGFPLI